VIVLKTETMQWEFIKTTGPVIEPRRQHVAVLVGQTMVIHGGTNAKQTCLDDIALYNMVKNTWKCIDTAGDKPGPLAYHAA
jgi:N-acetylneuraminic acid mutarotase